MTDDDDERMEEELRELDAAMPDRPAPRVLPKAGAAADAPPKHSLLIKLLMLGDSGVGKTTLLKRYAEGKFDPMIASTAGVAYETQYVELEGRNIRVDIWDTAGQERFHVITQAYYAGAHGIVLAYDASEAGETSFNSEGWGPRAALACPIVHNTMPPRWSLASLTPLPFPPAFVQKLFSG